MKFRRMKSLCLQDEVVDSSPHHMKAFVWDFEGSHRVPYIPNGVPLRVKFRLISRSVMKKGLGVDGQYPWFYILGARGRDSNPSIGINSFASPFNDGLSLENFIRALWEDGGGDFVQREFFQALPEGKRGQKLGQHRSFYIYQIVIDAWDLPNRRPHGRRLHHLGDGVGKPRGLCWNFLDYIDHPN